MAASGRFATAVHVMTLLARSGEECMTSEEIARSVNTNAVVIRRLLCVLSRADLVGSQKGPCGGGRLARPASDITLLDIYRAVEDRSVFALARKRPNRACHVGKKIEGVLAGIQGQMDAAVAEVLAGLTLDEIVLTVERAVEPRVARRIA